LDPPPNPPPKGSRRGTRTTSLRSNFTSDSSSTTRPTQHQCQDPPYRLKKPVGPRIEPPPAGAAMLCAEHAAKLGAPSGPTAQPFVQPPNPGTILWRMFSVSPLCRNSGGVRGGIRRISSPPKGDQMQDSPSSKERFMVEKNTAKKEV